MLQWCKRCLHNKNIIFKEALPNGWKLYGKTGSCSLLNSDKTKKLDIQQGWFVGWIQKNLRSIVVVTYIADDEKQELYAGPRAYAYAKEKLLRLINVLEKQG